MALVGELKLLVPMQGLIDVDAERERLGRQRDKLTAEIGKAKGKLGNEKFVSNAPPAVVEQERERLATFERDLAQVAEQLGQLDDLAGQ